MRQVRKMEATWRVEKRSRKKWVRKEKNGNGKSLRTMRELGCWEEGKIERNERDEENKGEMERNDLEVGAEMNIAIFH